MMGLGLGLGVGEEDNHSKRGVIGGVRKDGNRINLAGGGFGANCLGKLTWLLVGGSMWTIVEMFFKIYLAGGGFGADGLGKLAVAVGWGSMWTIWLGLTAVVVWIGGGKRIGVPPSPISTAHSATGQRTPNSRIISYGIIERNTIPCSRRGAYLTIIAKMVSKQILTNEDAVTVTIAEFPKQTPSFSLLDFCQLILPGALANLRNSLWRNNGLLFCTMSKHFMAK
ncbi:hypothetical protein ACH5RR_030287 [Cinchona calisaya]|uniref:Uncharacterized protein n=1 Tax=Cinchona calisaya TaxID=153742 RepID=A0ABD2YVI4_9GENT